MNKNNQLNQSVASLTEEQQLEKMTLETLILTLIAQNDIEPLKEVNFQKLNVNFLEPFAEVEIDQLITPLICACFFGRIEIIKMLMENSGIDLDLSSEGSGHTPLTISCMTGNFEIVKLLVEAGAEINKPTFYHHTPLICCFQRLEEEQNNINWIVNKTKGLTLLMQLCSIKMQLTEREKLINYEIIKFLVEHGASKSVTTHKNKTAFDLCEKHCNGEQIRGLLVNTQSKYNHKRPILKNQLELNTFRLKSSNPNTPLFTQQNNFNTTMGNMRTLPNHRKSKSLAQYLVFCNK